MSSYGDPNAGWPGDAGGSRPAGSGSAGRGRAQVNSDGYGYQYDDDPARRGGQPSPSARRDEWPDNGGGYGRASGSASVGSASVPGAAGSAPVPGAAGRASVGRAGVPGSSGRAGVPGAPVSPAGRASVRPRGFEDGPGDDGRGPGGPRGPRDRGGAGGDGGRPKRSASDKAKKAKRTKILIASFAAFLIIFGVGAIGGTYYFDSVDELTPENFKSAQTTMIMAGDNKTQLAQLGSENRIMVPILTIPEKTRLAMIAGEDKDFFEHHGISYSGIMRAAWKTLTTDETQGGSTITQQYIKIATDQAQISYARKLREAVLARKLEDKYDKNTIMGFYLNTIDFGRGAVGVEKAANAYFGKSAKDLTFSQAAVLGSVIRDPYDDGGKLSIYDPEAHPDTAKGRWGYVLDNMKEKGWITAEERASAQFPEVIKYSTVTTSAEWGIKTAEGTNLGKATGNVVNYVYEELKAQGIEPKDLRTGGYKVYTTIDPVAQKELEQAARPDIKGSELWGRKIVTDPKKKQDLESAGVVIDHTSGAVIAYYGGLDGTAIDLAGVNTQGGALVGGHPPGSSMKIYTLAAALDAGASLQSRWKAMPFTTDDKIKVGNAGSPNTSCKDYCTLEYSFMKSYNVPFYWVARQIGPGKVVKMASQAGVRYMWNNDNIESLSAKGVQNDTARTPFDRQVGFGQYGITVLDHATGVATLANGGVYNKPYFVTKVEKKDPVTGKYEIVKGVGHKADPKQAIKRQVANDVTYAMEKVFGDHNGWSGAQDGRHVAAKTGTWEGATLGKDGKSVPSDKNAHAWVVGFTKQFSLAVWTGNASGSYPVIDPKTGSTITSGSTPYRIWSEFIKDYSDAKKMPKEKLAEKSGIGDDEVGFANGVSPSPVMPTDPGQGGNCIPLVTCPTETTGPGNGGGNQSKSPTPSPSTSKSKFP
ncbi:MAG: penicillin-binding protein [Hamadaea sp.]|nr:penicillin-binding protein [Hamadaea sp.]